MKFFWGNLSATIVAIGIFICMILYAVRLGTASSLENLTNVTAIFLLGLIGIGLFYIMGKKNWLREPNPQVRQDKLDAMNKTFRKLLKIFIPAWLVIIAIHLLLLVIEKQ